MDAYDDVLNILKENYSSSEDNPEADTAVFESITAPFVVLAPRPLQVRKKATRGLPKQKRKTVHIFEEKYNMIVPENRDIFRVEVAYWETEMFTAPVSTTNTMEGKLEGVAFHEAELIGRLVPNEDFLVLRCNFGKVVYEKYSEPVRVRTTNRGRKKKEKIKKPRKKQGNGTDFNSQVTFVMKSGCPPVEAGAVVPSGHKVYKIKVFRDGKLQIPGVKADLIDDVIECTEKITGKLNELLHGGEDKVKIVNINPSMKNYKFVIKLPPGMILDLTAFHEAVKLAKAEHLVKPVEPPIFATKYSRQDTKMAVKFRTPIFRKPKKMTRVNVFMRGKVNILGGFEVEATTNICKFLDCVLRENYASIVVQEGGKCTLGGSKLGVIEEEDAIWSDPAIFERDMRFLKGCFG